MPVQRLSHIGICVTDLERSSAFYRDAFAFREVGAIETSGAETDQLLDLEGVKLRAVYLERDGTRIELLHFDAPAAAGQPGPHPVNRPGLTHLSFRVDDLNAVVSSVERLGGRVLAGSEIDNPRFQTKAVFVVDPDGLRIELLQTPGDPDSLPGAG
jgi:catechol 2,3-dioxygenase-like lactoylglutathione lyase family enzyme